MVDPLPGRLCSHLSVYLWFIFAIIYVFITSSPLSVCKQDLKAQFKKDLAHLIGWDWMTSCNIVNAHKHLQEVVLSKYVWRCVIECERVFAESSQHCNFTNPNVFNSCGIFIILFPASALCCLSARESYTLTHTLHLHNYRKWKYNYVSYK